MEMLAHFKPLFQWKRYNFLSGGRASGKSEQAARALLIKAASSKRKVLCLRDVQVSIADSVHSLLSTIINGDDVLYSIYIIKKNYIKCRLTGSMFIFRGMQDMVALKSLDSIDDCWVEESEAVTENMLDYLIPTIRGHYDAKTKKHSDVCFIFTYNPLSPDGDPIVKFNQSLIADVPNDVTWIHSTYLDNVFIPQAIYEEAERCKINRPAMYEHIWNGKPASLIGERLFNSNWLEIVPDIPAMDYDCVIITADSAMRGGKEHDGTAFIIFGLRFPSTSGTVAIKETIITIIDWQKVQINANLLDSFYMPYIEKYIATSKFHSFCLEDLGSGIALNQQLKSGRFARFINPITSKYWSHKPKDDRALMVSQYIANGSVKIHESAAKKEANFKGEVKNLLFNEMDNFVLGKGTKREDDLCDCLFYGIIIAFNLFDRS